MRILLKPKERNTPIRELLKEANHLSINQMAAYYSLSSAWKTQRQSGPHNKLREIETVRGKTSFTAEKSRTSRGEKTYNQRCRKLLNMLLEELSNEENLIRYKKLAKIWVAKTSQYVKY